MRTSNVRVEIAAGWPTVWQSRSLPINLWMNNCLQNKDMIKVETDIEPDKQESSKDLNSKSEDISDEGNSDDDEFEKLWHKALELLQVQLW